MGNIGGRDDRHRTGDPLVAKPDNPLQELVPFSSTTNVSNNRGVCFSLKANSNMLKTIHSCTVRTRTISAITCTPCKWRKRLRHPDLWNLLEAYQMSVHVENAFAYAVRCAGAVWSEAFEG